jgi:hypothetical protein
LRGERREERGERREERGERRYIFLISPLSFLLSHFIKRRPE